MAYHSQHKGKAPAKDKTPPKGMHMMNGKMMADKDMEKRHKAMPKKKGK